MQLKRPQRQQQSLWRERSPSKTDPSQQREAQQSTKQRHPQKQQEKGRRRRRRGHWTATCGAPERLSASDLQDRRHETKVSEDPATAREMERKA